MHSEKKQKNRFYLSHVEPHNFMHEKEKEQKIVLAMEKRVREIRAKKFLKPSTQKRKELEANFLDLVIKKYKIINSKINLSKLTVEKIDEASLKECWNNVMNHYDQYKLDKNGEAKKIIKKEKSDLHLFPGIFKDPNDSIYYSDDSDSDQPKNSLYDLICSGKDFQKFEFDITKNNRYQAYLKYHR